MSLLTGEVRRWCLVLLGTAVGFGGTWSGSVTAEDGAGVRAQATVRLTFDDDGQPAADTATVGEAVDNGRLVNHPQRVPSPFWNQRSGRAVLLDRAKQQYVELPDSVDLNRPDAVSFSLFAINLAAADDAAFQGLVAKRGDHDGKSTANYGINFRNQNDAFQVYVNDGSGFKVAQYSVKEALPPRKLMHLTATFAVATAPGSTTENRDVRVQLFANGKVLTPKSVSGGKVEGTAGWLMGVDPAGMVNPLPVTIGRSASNGEYLHAVVDEFLLFPRALTEDEAQRLFLETAGSDVEQQMQADQPEPIRVPEVARLSQPGFTVGTTQELPLVGKNLLPDPRVLIPAEGVQVEVVGEPQAERLMLKVTVDANARPGFYPLCVQTARGISEPQPIAVDILPQRPANSATAAAPAELPVALFGNLTGGQEPRHFFAGKRGDRIVADLELKRLGGQANPVLELKTAQGTPLTIAWGDSQWNGDVRLEARLPDDGVYSIDLHDLIYRAPGANMYRLKLGNLTLVDRPFPVAGGTGTLEFEPVGTGLEPGTRWSSEVVTDSTSRTAPLWLKTPQPVVGPWPSLQVSEIPEVVETTAPAGELQTVDATQPVAINGRLAAANERDVYRLNVTGGQKLKFLLESQSLQSPIAGEIEILSEPQGGRLAISSDQPSDADPVLEFTVPMNVAQVRVQVRDLFGRGHPRAIYRLVVEPSGRPDFRLVKSNSVAQLTESGTAVVELDVTRTNYNGPIALQAVGVAGVQIEPAQIAAGVSGKVLCRLQRTQPASADWPLLKIVGSTVDIDPPVRRAAQSPPTAALPEWSDRIALGQPAGSGLEISVDSPPVAIFKGAPQPVSVKLQRPAGSAVDQLPVRITSRSTEPPRLQQPNNPNAGQLPLVQITPATVINADEPAANVVLQVPLDVAVNQLELALVAEAVPHAYSDRVIGTAYALPFRVSVQTAAAPKLDASTLTITAESPSEIRGKLTRTAGFTAPVRIALNGLPQGYKFAPVEVPGDQDDFVLVVTAPAVAAEAAVPNVKLNVTVAGSAIAADQDVPLKVKPAAAPAATDSSN